MIKKLMVFAMTLVATLALGTAQAHASWNACPLGRFCMWAEQNYWGTTSFVLYPTGQCLTSPTWVSSIRNHRPLTAYIYTSSNCTTGGWLVNSGQSYSPPPIGDNAMRSFRLSE